MENIYRPIKVDHRPTPDWRTPAVIAFGVTLLCVLGGLIFAVLRTQYLYNRYSMDMVSSMAYARRNDSFALYDGEHLVSREMPEMLRAALVWNGRPVKTPPEAPAGVTITYGDGSSTRLWETTFADYSQGHGAERKPGILLEYTSAEGKTYLTETAADYPYLRAYLLGQIQDYFNPTAEELVLLEAGRDGAP